MKKFRFKRVQLPNSNFIYVLIKLGIKRRKLRKTIHIVKFLVRHTDRILCKHDCSELDTIDFFLFGLLERLNVSLKALEVLYKRVEYCPELEFSCGLIIRTAILDLLSLLKGYDMHQTNIDAKKPSSDLIQEFEKFCNGIFVDGLDITMSYLIDLKSVGRMTQPELKKLFTSYSNKHSDFIYAYQGDGSHKPSLKFAKIANGAKLFRILSGRPEVRQIAQIYDTYLFYSKYEHYSIESFEVMAQNFESKIDRLKTAVEFLALQDFLLCSLLRDFTNEAFFEKESKTIAEYIENEVLVSRGNVNRKR